MAVLQISKIQVRRGQKSQSGIPVLSAGEFAWAVDAQELYIGNGSVSEGAPFVGNTRLLTELDASNIFQLASTYTYEGNTSATVITGADANSPVSRTLQDKLDDYVSLADFGAVGDGITNDTKALQRAIDQLYLNSDKSNPLARKKLRFPAGTYLITGTIYIPSYATIEGDGIDRTIIKQSTTATAIFQTVDWTSTSANKIQFPSIQSTTQPKNISLSGMTLQYDSSTKQGLGSLVYLDCTLDSSIEKCKFLGLATVVTNDTQSAIDIRGQGSTTSKKIKIKECEFKNIATGITSDYDVYDIEIDKSKFDTMRYGVKFGETLSGLSPNAYGPIGVLIQNSFFENIHTNAIYGNSNVTNTPTNFTTINNKFYNVGNELSQSVEDNQKHPVNFVLGGGVRSINDNFGRTLDNLAGAAGPLEIEIFGNVDYKPLGARSLSLAVSSIPVTIAVVPKYSLADPLISIDYIARQSSLNVTRMGKVQIITNATTSTWSDSFQYVGANTLIGDIQFNTSLNTTTNTLSVEVTNPVGSVTTDFTYSYSVLY